MSQIATTIEQSKRLIAAGLIPESADMLWTAERDDTDGGTLAEPILLYIKESMLYSPSADAIPAWSLSKLWDMLGLDILGGWFSVGSSTSEDVIEELVRIHENRRANH